MIRLVDEIFTLLSIGNSEASRSDWPNAGSVCSKPGFSLCGGKSLFDAPQLPGGGVDDWYSIVRTRAPKDLGRAGSGESERWG